MRNTRLWTGLASVFSFLLVFTVIGMDCLMYYQGTVNDVLGIQTSKVITEEGANEDAIYYESEYGELNAENLQKLIADTYEHSVTEQEEGSVLLRNEEHALPLSGDEMRVTLFGHAVCQPCYKAASAGSSGYLGEYNIDLYTALTDAGFVINDTLYDAYVNSKTKRGNGGVNVQTMEQEEWSIGEEDISFYTDELRMSWENDYNDAAIVMLTRESGEGLEMYQEDPEEGISQLALHQKEKDLLQMIKDSGKFEKTIVLINSGWAMELGWLETYDIDACLWIGLPGQRGFEGVANLLKGEADPSGHLTDTYAYNSQSAPALVNASYNITQWTNVDEVVAQSKDDADTTAWVNVQAEGIYVGYKYYETRYEDCILNQGKADSVVGSSTGEAWDYAKEVQFPFGYGLSYSEFEQKLEKVEVEEDTITVTVSVTNTGDMAGKSVVQVYAQTPYGEYEKENLVEKSAIQLLDFAKTDILEPGESQTLTIECDKYLLASYDYTKAKTYILSEGEYYISIGEDAHDALNNVLAAKGAEGMLDVLGNKTEADAQKTYRWEEEFDDEKYAVSQYTGNEITNQFDDCDINYWVEDAVVYVSRNDWDATYPREATQVAASKEMMDVLRGDYYEKPEDAPSVDSFVQGDNQGIPLAAMAGIEYDDPLWETFLNQMTLDELAVFTSDMMGSSEVPSVGVPAVRLGDGPDGFAATFDEEKYGDGRDVCCFPCELVLASTFNKELMLRRGELLGEACLYTNRAGGWMIASNLHRTPFGGRNFEYYSEDGVMNYLCSIPATLGMESKGVYAAPKHFVGNDQEFNRQGVACFFTEQGLRENALRGFEGSMAAAKCKGVMQAFNRLGLKWCSSSEALCTEIAVNEWGFQGIQITDAIAYGGQYKRYFSTSLSVGTDCWCIDFNKDVPAALVEEITKNDDGNLLRMLRESAHEFYYVVANNAVMNGYGSNSKVVSITPWWQPAMYVIIVVVAVLDMLCIAMLILGKRKKK